MFETSQLWSGKKNNVIGIASVVLMSNILDLVESFIVSSLEGMSKLV